MSCPSPVAHSVGVLGTHPISLTLWTSSETGPPCRPARVGVRSSASQAGSTKAGRLGSMAHLLAHPRRIV
jgi:hypothetical protein